MQLFCDLNMSSTKFDVLQYFVLYLGDFKCGLVVFMQSWRLNSRCFLSLFFVIVLYMLNVVNLTCTTVFNREQNHWSDGYEALQWDFSFLFARNVALTLKWFVSDPAVLVVFHFDFIFRALDLLVFPNSTWPQQKKHELV